MVVQKAAALLIGDDPFYSTQSALIIRLAGGHGLPTMHYRTDYVAAGELIIGRILKGEKPSDLPVMQPTKFELAINLKTAKLLGLTEADFRQTPSECGREFAPLILDRK